MLVNGVLLDTQCFGEVTLEVLSVVDRLIIIMGNGVWMAGKQEVCNFMCFV